MSGSRVWTFRVAVPADLPFIYDAWLSSFRDSKWAGVVPNNEYRPTYTKTINDLLRRGMVVTLAVADNDPNHLLGRPTLSTRTIRSPVDGSSPAETRTS